MKKNALGLAVAAALVTSSNIANAADPVFMSATWAEQACAAWNADPVLTGELKKSGWIDNNKGRGFKIMQIYRKDCPDSPKVEMKIEDKDGKATCTYGGAAVTAKLESSADYVMYATGDHWLRMGEGKDGPMKAMMFGRLKFEGPKMEAMGNMGPFKNFLLLTGKVASDRSTCPTQ